MRRILVFTAWYPNPANPIQYTFVKQQVFILSKYLQEISGEDWKFLVWNELKATDLFNQIFRKKALRLDWEDEGISVFTRQRIIPSHRLPFDQPQFVLQGMKRDYLAAVDKLGGEPDLVWCITLTSANLWNKFITQNNIGANFILQEHANPLNMHLRKPWNRDDAKTMLKRAKSVLVVADRQISEFKALDSDCKPIVIFNAVAEEFMAASVGKKSLDRFAFIFVGRFSAEKGLMRLFRAANKLIANRADFVIKLVGAGPEESRLRDYIEEKNISGFFEWLGPMSSSEINQELEEANAFVLPSLYENCPVALLEAQVKGLPCVCTINGASEKVLLAGNGIVVDDNGEGHELADALAEMIRTYSSYDRASIQNRSIAEFAPEVFAKKMHKVFVEAMS